MLLLLKRSILVTAIFFAVINVGIAQSYYNSPSDSLTATTALGHTVALNITQRHPTADTIYFKWKKLSVSMPVGWDAYLCDNGHCFTTLMDSGMMIPIVPGDNGLMLLHCTPHLNLGTAIIRYTIYATNTPLHIDTLTWIVNANTTGIESYTEEDINVWYFQNNIHLTHGAEKFETIKVIDASGITLFKTMINFQTTIRLPQFNCATCIIELDGNIGKWTKKISTLNY